MRPVLRSRIRLLCRPEELPVQGDEVLPFGRHLLLVEDRLHAEGVAFTLHCPDSLYVRCRPALLEQVFLNLLANARQGLSAVTAAEKWVRLEAVAVRHRSGECVELRVEDNGCGIDDVVSQRIFQPFFTTKQGGSSSGLGMAIVDRVVRAAEGRIEIESAPGRGTRVSIRFPAA